ncbi:MAG: lamin tail domain-containing protein [Anaerolineae bacterium]|nr:lamin tail domain-containing protein [Anaerolineae bacterium]
MSKRDKEGMSFSSQIPFLIAVFVVAIAGTFLAIQIFGNNASDAATTLVTVEVIVSATPDSNATSSVVIVTATSDRTQVSIPDGIVPEGDGSPVAGARTVIPVTPNEADITSESGLSVPTGCILHIVDSGDTVFGIADEYGVSGFLMLQVNGLDDDSAAGLQIGDELIVPVDTCPVDDISPPPTATAFPTETLEVTEELTQEATEDANITPTLAITPTITLAPTAEDAVLEIVGVVDANDVTAEGIRIRNPGSSSTVTVTGWTLEDLDGNVYEFRSQQRIFSNSEVTIYTRTGQDTPIALFWGLDEAVWQEDDVVTLRDENGRVQAIFRIPADIDL